MFRKISPDEFDKLLASAAASPAFREEFGRFEFNHDRRYIDAVVQEGDLVVEGPLIAPAFYVLVLGDLSVKGAIDLRGNYDAGGLFIVIGNVVCGNFVSEYDAGVFIDGDLTAGGAVVSAYSDSAFSVTGTVRARLLIGNDIWISVGDGAEIDYGIGYCAPLGVNGTPIIEPRHDEAETIAALALEPKAEGYPFEAEDVAERIRAGQPIFKQA